MSDTAARLLALLSLLQSRPDWSGTELAERLGVTTRTIRNDIERLRELDYPVDATRGAAGGYRLGAGGKLPPLLLDDEEAVAVAIGLREATGIVGIQESSTRALAKLEQVLPSRLRPMVDRDRRRGRPRAREHRHGCPRPRGRPRRARRDRGRHPRRGVAPLRRPRHAPARRAVPPAQLAAALVPRRARPAVGRVGRVPRGLDRSRGCRRAAASPPARCPAATTPRSRCARSR